MRPSRKLGETALEPGHLALGLVLLELVYIMLNLLPLTKTQTVCLFLQSKLNVSMMVQIMKRGKMWSLFVHIGLEANEQKRKRKKENKTFKR